MDSRTRGLWIILGVVLIMALAFSTLTAGVVGWGLLGHRPWDHALLGWGSFPGRTWVWGWGLGNLATLVFWGLLIVGGVALMRASAGSPERGPDTPIDILKRRYAAGELTREQYERMRTDLET